MQKYVPLHPTGKKGVVQKDDYVEYFTQNRIPFIPSASKRELKDTYGERDVF